MTIDLDIEDIIITKLLARELNSRASNTPPIRMRTGQSGQDYIKELLSSAHPARIRQVLRMKLATFNAWRDWLLMNTNLSGQSIWVNCNRGGHAGHTPISIDEKLVIFLHIVTLASGHRATAERFSHSQDTISRLVYKSVSKRDF